MGKFELLEHVMMGWSAIKRSLPRGVAPTAPLAALALVLVACTGGTDSEGVTQDEYLNEAEQFLEDRERYANEVVRCAAEQGFDAQVTWDHGFEAPPGLSRAQVDQYWEVVDECSNDIFPDHRRPTDEELERQYDLLVAAAECLEEGGFEVPEPSSLEAFVSAYQTDEPSQPGWNPYRFVNESGQFRAAASACPIPGSF